MIQNQKMDEELYQKTSSKDSDTDKDVLGVDGKYEWPVRIISFLLFAGTVVVNYLIGLQTGRVSDAYSLFVTPPSLFFNIWAVIFSLMAIVNIINLVKNEWTMKAHIWLGLNNICLIVWINVFNVGNDPAVYVCALILIATVVIALKFWDAMGEVKEFTWFTYVARNVYAFYLGWVIAATNLNLGIVFVYWWAATY